MIEPRSLFAEAERTFAAACAADVPAVGFVVAGRTVVLRFATAALAARLTPAFAHLEPAAPAADADLTICAWDDASSGVALGEPATGMTGPGLVYAGGPVRVAWDIETRNLQALDLERRLAFFRYPDLATLPAWEEAAPFRRILHWWTTSLDLQLVHGAAVGTDDGAVLLVGQGGSGKSTTALACVGSALGYLGDDYCLVEPGAAPRVHAIFGSGKADAGSIARLPRLAPAFAATRLVDGHKRIVFVHDHFPDAFRRSLPLRAIIVPKIVPGTAGRLEPLGRAEALRALAPSTLFQVPGDQASSFARMSALIRDLTCWRLFVGGDPQSAQPLIADLLAGSARR